MARNTFATIGILAVLLLSLTVASAATFTITNVTYPASIAEDSDLTFTYNITYTGTSENMDITFEDSVSNVGMLSTENATGLNGSANEFVILTGIVTGLSGKGGQNLIVTINGTTTGGSRENHTFTIPITSVSTPTSGDTLCEFEGFDDEGDLEISDFDINNNGEGNDEEWQYLDELEVVIEVENTNKDDDIEDVEVKMVIFDDKIENGGNDVTNDFDVEDEIITSIGKLKDDDQETVTFMIEVPSDTEDGTYYMYIMTYEDGNEDNQCMSESSKLDDDFYFKFSVESVDYDESVVVRGTALETQIDTYCGQQNLEISFPVYNLGSDEEDKVLVNIFNSALGINEFEVIDDLDNGDQEMVNFFVNIPSELSKERYDVDVRVHFDWDNDEDDDDILSYDEETSDRSVRLSMLSCRGADPSITAALDSETVVGKELVIKATVTNNGDDNDFVISVSDFESWAELVSVSPQTTSIDEDDSVEVIIKLMPTKEGTQSFEINAIVDGETTSQSVSLSIAEDPSVFAGISDTLLYIIIGIIVLLILIFLALIVRISRRAPKPQF